VLSLFKRTPVNPPPLEWQCASFRHVNILNALEHATDSTVSLYRDGKLQWSRDVAISLHEFTCRPVEHVLKHASAMRLPVYTGNPENSHDPNSAALALAQQQAEPNAHLMRQIVFQLPDSFTEALACKRRWLNGNANADDIRSATVRVLQDTQFFWPSNFCLQMNALQTAAWCVLSALNIETPWLSAHGCASTAASFLGCRVACETIGCSSAPHNTTELVWESAHIGNRTFTRGVGCPQAGHPQVEQQATMAINATSQEWWQRFNEELATTLIEDAT